MVYCGLVTSIDRVSEGGLYFLSLFSIGNLFGHNLLIRGGLRAYALTLPLLGVRCTWYEIKFRDMNEKGKDFIFYNKQAFMVHCTWPGCVHSVCPCSYPSARSACTHTVALPACLGRGVEGCMNSNIFFLFPFND